MEQIAVLLQCCPNTLRNRFREEIERGPLWLSGILMPISFQLAMEGNVRALIWHMKQRGLVGKGKPPQRVRRRKPRGLVPSSAIMRPGRTYQPFGNRYRAGRKPRSRPRILPSAPTTAPAAPAPVPEPGASHGVL